ncbi:MULTISPECIES: BrxE family protein [Aeromonas]|uniref:BrxE family protein n=1 Tax=Aeromonas TaxID=642 RepID=UPI000C281A25|nr:MULTISPECIES: BrxE family protein [Aeromonas]ATY77158.1 BrxE family protein [Aeromonas veronii]QWZ65210.1 BrxE family protein [Aeromonas sp. FDAARGOS 1417]
MNTIAKTIAELRVLVGYLGEHDQANWWGSQFFGATAAAFLAPIFNRSLFLAQYQGSTAAAAKVHDEVIGVGRIYHLFRLPLGLEQASADALNDITFVQAVQARLVSREFALTRLTELAKKTESASPGPVSLGLMSQDISAELQRAAGFYCAAFTSGIQTFPYIREAE